VSPRVLRAKQTSTPSGCRRASKTNNNNRAIEEIRKQQDSTELLIPKASFQRLAREIGNSLDPRRRYSEVTFRWTKEALEALQAAAEDYLVSVFGKAQICALHAKRVTLKADDLALIRKLEESW
jgi:histone H3/H4